MSAALGLFVGLHMQIARLSHTPEFAIGEVEARAYLQTCANVARHFPVQMTQKAFDIAIWVGATGVIYAPRVLAVMRPKQPPGRPSSSGQQQQRPPAPAPTPLFEFAPNGAPNGAPLA